MNKLMEIELEEIEDISQEKERFKIENLESANWALRKLKAIEGKGKEITALANKEIERILEWKDGEIKQLGDSKDFFDFLLTEYYTEQKALDPKFKISTPYGMVSSRKQQDKWNYEDDKVLEWLKENDKELIRIKEEINKSELKKKYKSINGQVVTEDGEIMEGITVEERPDTITIKVVE